MDYCGVMIRHCKFGRTFRGNAPKTPTHGMDVDERLWSVLKRINEQGYRFRRKTPFAGFLLDFVDHDIRLVIEIADGAPSMRLSPNLARHHVLRHGGYTVLTFRRDDAAEDFGSWVETIKRVLEDRPPSPTADLAHEK